MATDMDSRLTALEEEMKSTKTQIQQILLDLREHVLEFTNPFTAEAKLALAKKVDEKIKEMKKQKAERKKAMKARRG
ncbi:MAG: hypothetical protein HQ478_02385 [Chloroflexi bacterium]|nr:hypothetical protein [Chloroflexota bacterium]